MALETSLKLELSEDLVTFGEYFASLEVAILSQRSNCRAHSSPGRYPGKRKGLPWTASLEGSRHLRLRQQI